MGSELDYHELTAERDALKQQLSDATKQLERSGAMYQKCMDKVYAGDDALVECQTALCNLLAIIHRDGGHHTTVVGLGQSVADAHQVWAGLQKDVGDANAARAKAEADAGVLRLALERVISLGHNDDCIPCGFKDRTADIALASDAGVKAVAVIDAAKNLIAATSWSLTGEWFVKLQIAVIAMEGKDGG